jgi:flagellar hook-length control protein FliK
LPDFGKKLPVARAASATDTGPKTADAKQVDAPAPQAATGGVPAQGIQAQPAVQSPASALTIAPDGTEAAVQATAPQPTDAPGAASSGAAPSQRAASQAGTRGFTESLVAAAESSGQPLDGQPDATQAVNLAGSTPPAADATKPSAAPERETRDSKPADGPLAAREAATTKPNEPAARPASGESAAGSDQADRVRFVQRVARAFESATDRGGTVRLRLSPPELGSLRLELTVHDGKMSARIEAETQSARNLLLENLPALRQRLAEHQIQVERFDVDWGGRPSGSLPQQSQDQSGRSHPQAGSNAVSRVDPQDGAAAGQPATARPGYGSRLDVVI